MRLRQPEKEFSSIRSGASLGVKRSEQRSVFGEWSRKKILDQGEKLHIKQR